MAALLSEPKVQQPIIAPIITAIPKLKHRFNAENGIDVSETSSGDEEDDLPIPRRRRQRPRIEDGDEDVVGEIGDEEDIEGDLQDELRYVGEAEDIDEYEDAGGAGLDSIY